MRVERGRLSVRGGLLTRPGDAAASHPAGIRPSLAGGLPIRRRLTTWLTTWLTTCPASLTLLLQIGSVAAAPPVFRNTGPDVAYVGSKACAGCHDAIYRKYVRTAMGRSITRAEATPLIAAAGVRSEALQRDFKVFRENGQLYQSESEQRQGQTIFETTHQLEYAVGSGENGISFAVRRGSYLFQAPLSYFAKAGAWAMSPGFEESGEGFNRPVYEACIVCHAGRPRAVPGRDGLYRDPPFAEMAIGCENCHGPGQLHVEERGSGTGKLPDTSIVNPARLPARVAEDICMQCHQAGDARVLLPKKDYGAFRPSAPLVRTVAIVGLPGSAKDIDLLEHHSSMKLSRCYQATGGKLSCLTCHDPHEQPEKAEAATYFRAKCLGCHTGSSCRLSLQARRQTAPPDDCAGCHMPKRDVARISHSALTNHRIPARPGARASVPERAPDLRAPDLPADDLPGLLLLNSQPGEPALPLVTRLAAYGELMTRAPELQPKYLELLEQARHSLPEDPLVLAALGRQALGRNRPEALDWLLKAEEKGAAGVLTYLDLNEALSRAGRTPDAVAALERGEAVFPYSQAIRKHLILAYIGQKQYPKARQAMDRYVQDFPEDSFMRGLLSQIARTPVR